MSIVRELVRNGVHVRFIGTSEDKGRRIERELDGNGPACRFVKLDLSNLRAVREFARALSSNIPALDLLVNVAGVVLPERQETADGFEKTFAIDYLSSFVLCMELRKTLAAANHARIVNVGGLPFQVLKPQLDFDDLHSERAYDGMRVAIKAVHAKLVLTEVLAEAFKRDSIDVNAFHPGWVKSDLARNMSFPMSLVFSAMSVFFSSSSKSGIYASTSPEVTGMTGQFFVNRKPRPLSFEQQYKDRLWSETERMVERALARTPT